MRQLVPQSGKKLKIETGERKILACEGIYGEMKKCETQNNDGKGLEVGFVDGKQAL